MDTTVYLYGQGGAENHGCEAIVRSIAQLLAPAKLEVYSYHPAQDIRFGLNQVAGIHAMTNDFSPEKRSWKSVQYHLRKNLLHSEVAAYRYWNAPVIRVAKPGRCMLSVGGDVYCYPAWRNLAKLNDFLAARSAKLVLWGASVEPGAIAKDEALRTELARYALITARESISYQALKQVNPHTLLVCDTAFALQPEPTALPEGFAPGRTIGVNLSPLVARGAVNDIVWQNYSGLIDWLLEHTDETVALIPHVTWADVDDQKPLAALYEKYKTTGRVVLLDDRYNCCQLKWLIAQCSAFVGARTHATIAAYSSGVPTLVCGYSVKARGIARDLFGTENGYVVPVQQMTVPGQLADAFAALYARRADAAATLKAALPAYLTRLEPARQAVKALVGQNQ